MKKLSHKGNDKARGHNPFFNKNGSPNFFSKDKTRADRFFKISGSNEARQTTIEASPSIQQKCENCESAKELLNKEDQADQMGIQKQPLEAPLIQRNPDRVSQRDIDLLREVEDELDGFISRFRNWLTHNLSLFLADAITSGDEQALVESLNRDGFGSSLIRTMVGDAIALGGITAGSRAGGRNLLRFFLVLRTARAFGVWVGFVIGAIIETIVASLFDRTDEIIRESISRVDTLVTSVINPVVDSIDRDLVRGLRTLRDNLNELDEPTSFWEELRTEFRQMRDNCSQSILDERDESLYRQLALQAGIYSGSEVVAETDNPERISGQETQFSFSMQHRMVDTGRTRIDIPQENSTLVITSRGFDCLNEDNGEFHPVDARGQDAPNSWLQAPPSNTYKIMLLRIGSSFFGESASEIDIPRVYNVNSTGYGIWYNLPSGTYAIRIYRRHSHPVALCGECSYRVEPGS